MILKKITILGPGLLGGSVGLASQAAGYEVVMWGRKQERVELAREYGLTATTQLLPAVYDADLIVLAVPVGVMKDLSQQLIGHLKQGALVTDVGSVKALPHHAAKGLPFIGSHPMAGSEQTGIEAARADLLNGAACVITNQEARSAEEVSILESFWEALGCRVHQMTVEDHDRAVARISHLPHAMAVLTAESALKFPNDVALAAGGFRDTTRVASGDPTMWAEIMMENKDALTHALKDAQQGMKELLKHLENGDQEELERYLEGVKQSKDRSGC